MKPPTTIELGARYGRPRPGGDQRPLPPVAWKPAPTLRVPDLVVRHGHLEDGGAGIARSLLGELAGAVGGSSVP